MKPGVFSILFILLSVEPALAQELGIRKMYFKDKDVTVVKTPYIPLIDSPAELMLLQLVGRSPKQQQPVEAPESITLSLDSHARQFFYQEDLAHKLVIVADNEQLNLGLLEYRGLKSTLGGPKGDYIVSSVTGWVESFPVPLTAAVFSGDQTGWVVEDMYTHLQLEQLTKIARAERIELKLGPSRIVLTEPQMKVLKDFFAALMSPGEALTPGEGNSPEETLRELTADAPSDANNTALDVTVDWLKKEIIARGRFSEPVGEIVNELISSSPCEVRYRIFAHYKPSLYEPSVHATTLEYVIKLAELNPEAVRISDSARDRTFIFIATRNVERTIERKNIEWGSGRVLGRAWESSTIIGLKQTKSAFRIGDAIKHAIKLCQSQG